ncbi:hypothetical protein HLB23_14370 [Nocardia uniformis]|uniref:Uncharacterized protein n=1 Tax=Nocardia uniformis TaxID=53432 RepID=A0A849C3W9_9NOCA|nr:hypothetical protein [Nocardia uniformis]NNH71035.1 hypothetical protein [Nocardia uniformis]
MNSGQRIPTPGHREPLLPAGMLLAGYTLSTIVVGVFGGGAVSGALSGHGVGIVAPEHMSATLARLAAYPADPAAAWPNDPRPGPAWLTWTCFVLISGLWCAGIAATGNLIDRGIRPRRRDGLASVTDLRVIGLDHRAAVHKAAREYPQLAGCRPRRHRFRWRWRR